LKNASKLISFGNIKPPSSLKPFFGEIMSVTNRVLISGRQTGQTSKHWGSRWKCRAADLSRGKISTAVRRCAVDPSFRFLERLHDPQAIERGKGQEAQHPNGQLRPANSAMAVTLGFRQVVKPSQPFESLIRLALTPALKKSPFSKLTFLCWQKVKRPRRVLRGRKCGILCVINGGGGGALDPSAKTLQSNVN